MSNLHKIITGILMLSLLLTAYTWLSCSGEVDDRSPDYAGALDKVSNAAVELTVKSYQTERQITINRENPEFNRIIEYLEQSTLTRNQPRYVTHEGEKQEVAIPYALNYILAFTLDDGSELSFDYGTQIWFNTDETIYGASTDEAMAETLKQLLGE